MKNCRAWQIALVALALGAVSGYAATGRLAPLFNFPDQEVAAFEAISGDEQESQGQPPQPKPPLGSPAATQSPKSKYLPPPPIKFGGQIGLSAGDSKPFWQPKVVPPKGAPNVVVIMTDDVGFGAPSTFGGVIPTPTMDRIAKAGLRYNNLCSTALCSPTRAAIITGRNHHSCHFGVISELATGFPGYDSMMDETTATIATILRQYGYATAWIGKNHNTPAFEASAAGPFTRWPTGGFGFDYFYGFLGGDSNQWQPYLYRNTSPIFPFQGKKNWNLITEMANDAIGRLDDLNSTDPAKPFFLYYVPGGTHAPHHPTPEWIAKFKGKFDNGWDNLREEIFKNQQKLGVIPKDAKLTPWPKELPEWKTLNADEKKLFAKQAEVYAAYLAYTDYETGRVIQAIQDMGKLDNTLIIYVSGDNGCSAEGSPIGSPNEVAVMNVIEFPVDVQLKKFYDVWGSDRTYPHMSCAWAWAFSTPFKWMKQIAAYFGGTRQGTVICWPNRIKDKEGIREQFCHVIDIVPTILEACGIPEPVSVNGVPQRPIEGTSLVYTFDKKNQKAKSKHTTQYFEMLGNCALYHEGWIASAVPFAAPWDLGGKSPKDMINGVKWELYDLTKDFSQYEDVSKENPEKLKDMKDLFLAEAAKYNVFPLDGSKSQRFVVPRPSVTAGRTKFVYTKPGVSIPTGDAPNQMNRSYSITAEIDIPKEGAEGMLLTHGGRFGGYGLYLLKGRPVFTYNFVDLERTKWDGKEALKPGKHTIVYQFTHDPKTKGVIGPFGKGGTGVLKVDGKVVAEKVIQRTIPLIFTWDETFDIGQDLRTPVDDEDYQCPFPFTGKLIRVTMQLESLQLAPAAAAEFQKKTQEPPD